MNIVDYIKGKIFDDMYVQVWERRLKVSNIRSKKIFDEVPLIAVRRDVDKRFSIEAIGNRAKSKLEDGNYDVVNPFSHPRLLISDIRAAETLLKFVFRKLTDNGYIVPSPRVIFQPMEKLEGGVTAMEERTFRELCLGAGARDVYLQVGNELLLHDLNFQQVKNKSGK